MKGQPSGRFLGVNLRQDRVSMADEEVAKAINADFHLQPGVIVLRLGRTAHNDTVLSNLAIRRLAKINGHRYQVAGTRLYCDYTIVSDISSLGTSNITTFMPFRPLNDDTTWAYIANDSTGSMFKVDCQERGAWGTGVPQFPTIKAGTLISFLNAGVYTVAYTQVRLVSGAAAFESNPSNPFATITLSFADSLNIGDMTDVVFNNDTVNAVGIYRSLADSGVPLLDGYYSIPSTSSHSVTQVFETDAMGDAETTLKFHWSINLNSQSVSGVSVNCRGSQQWEPDGSAFASSEDIAGRRATYLWEITDLYVITQTRHWAKHLNVVDASLGAIIETDNGDTPGASWAVAWQEHAWLCGGITHPNYLYFSKRFRPEAWPADQILEIGTPDDPLQCALPIGGMLGVFSRKTKYRVVGNAVSGFVALEAASPRGTNCPLAAITTERGITFVAKDGIFNTFLASPDQGFADKILPLFFGETVNDMLPINWEVASTFSAAIYKDRYYFAYADTQHATPNMVAVYSWSTGNWYHYDMDVRSQFVEEDTDFFLAGGIDGFVYKMENGSTDGGSSIALDVETKDFSGDSKDIRKLFLGMKVDTDTGGATVTVKFYVDDTLEHTTTVSTSSRTKTLLKLPEGVMGYQWRVKFTYTGSTRIRLYGCAALFLPMGAM
jgi:hypothetical protein